MILFVLTLVYIYSMGKTHKIVVVEDEPAINEMYRMKLELSGYSVVTAFNGLEGLGAIKKHQPDLVLLDIKMPVMSGDEMLAKLRETDWGADIPVIILTNISRDEAPHNLRLLNVKKYIVKAHYTPSQVIEEIKTVLA